MKLKLFALMTLLATLGFAQQRAVFGVVTDSAGKPLEGVTVLLETVQYPADKKSSKSDSKGRYGIYDHRPGDVIMKFSLEGYLDREIQYRTQEDKIRVKQDVSLYKTGDNAATAENSVEVVGKIYDTKGNVLNGVKIICTVDGTPFRSEAAVDETGTYKIRGFKQNENQLRGMLQGYRDQILKVRVQDDPLDLTGPQHFIMKTVQEAYAELGQEAPKGEDEKATPEEEAIVLYNLAIEPYQQGSYAQAEELAKKALELNPAQLESLKLLVFSNLKLEDWKETLVYAEKVLASTPDDINMLTIAAQAAENSKNKEKAKAYNAKLKAKGAAPVSDPWDDAYAAMNAKDDGKLAKILQAILVDNPKDAKAYLEIAKIKVREGEFDDAKVNAQNCMKHAAKSSEEYTEAKELILMLSE